MTQPFVHIITRADGPVLFITLNRPEVRNAMSGAMVQELRAALAVAEQDKTTRVLVLRGAGGHFCAGGDVRGMADARAKLATDPQALVHSNAMFGELCAAFAATPLAVVAVLEGTVMGGGFGLACVADVALAGPTVVFRLPETTLGLVPAQVGPYLVERVGYSQAKRLAVTGQKLDAAQALAIGLVHEAHAADGLDAALSRLLDSILSCAPQALSATKALLAKARFNSPESLVLEAAQVFSTAALGAEGTEGGAAFLQKRKPAWSMQSGSAQTGPVQSGPVQSGSAP